MGKEINLLKNYPKAKRDINKRLEQKTEQIKNVAREFGKDFFDGDRQYGYGGFNYNQKYWSEVVKDFVNHYKLSDYSKILDVGCAKGFMLYDFQKLNKNFDLHGIDVSEYAIENSVESIKNKLKVGDAKALPYEDNFFDLVISINTIHNLEAKECGIALKEISRVSKGNAFVTVDAFNNDYEKEKMYAWNLTAKTIMSVDEWIKFFKKVNYNGDYFWFIP
jgi:ubiquinone/menaquinone biosynthesis C-methylase UbiE